MSVISSLQTLVGSLSHSLKDHPTAYYATKVKVMTIPIKARWTKLILWGRLRVCCTSGVDFQPFLGCCSARLPI